MDENEITFCQADLPCISFAAIYDMRKSVHLCDVTIKVQNHSITAHRVILAAAIPYFRSLFTNDDIETKEKEITVGDLEPKALESLIDFAYSSKVNISVENVQSLLVASQFLQLHQVQGACVEFLSKRLKVSNVVQVRALGLCLNSAVLIENSNRYMRENFEEFAKCDEFLDLSLSCIKDIISEDGLEVQSEEIVLEAILNWVKYAPLERKGVLPELLHEVRLVFIPVNYLLEKVDCEDLITSSKPCRDLINEVKSYHLLPQKQSNISSLKTVPRIRSRCSLYAIGACGTCGWSMYYFDFIKRTWCILDLKKMNGELFNVISVNWKIGMFIGETLQTFDPKTREWEMFAMIPSHVHKGAAIASFQNRIYWFGSCEDHSMNSVKCFDIQKNKWMREGKMPMKRYDLAAVSLGNLIYLTGGFIPSKSLRTNAVEQYDPSSDQFINTTPMQIARDEHGCTSINGKIYVCGGKDNDGCTINTVEEFDPSSDQWKFISPMHKPRYEFSIVPCNSKIYAFDGNDVEVYSAEDHQWETDFTVPVGFKRALSIFGVSS